MHAPTRSGGRGHRALAVAAACTVMFVTGCGASTPTADSAAADAAQTSPTSSSADSTPSSGMTSSTTSSSATSSSATSSSEPTAKVLPASPPTNVDIPSIGVSTDGLVELGLTADGNLEAPEDYGTAGWYAAGPTPGQVGPAVIAGHVDSESGPAIFYRLGELEPGDEIFVDRKNGSRIRFVVDRVERFPKSAVPTSEVFGRGEPVPQLRLITCGGAFNEATGHYVDNVIVFATIAR